MVVQVRRTWWLATPHGFSPSACHANPKKPRKQLLQGTAKSLLPALPSRPGGIEKFPLGAPPAGYHSVYGVATPTGPLNYDEIVVYDEAAALPEFLIVISMDT